MNLATDFTHSRLYETDAGMRAKMRRHGKRFVKQTAWKDAHAKEFKVEIISHPDREMSAANEFFSGTATWRYDVGNWSCIRADECLKFLLKKSVGDAQPELTRRGFKYQWKERS